MHKLASELCAPSMSLYFRPPEIQSAGGDVAGPGGLELPGAGLSAGVESQLAAASDVSQAHTFFQPGMKAGALSVSTITPGAERAFIGPMPGADAAAVGGLMPGAEQVSPLIQMIMKLPGIGAITSFFDALAAFFMPTGDVFAGFDLTQIGVHAQGAVASLSTGIGEHLPISLSLLPANAPFLQGLGLGAGHGMHGLTYLPGKLGASLSDHGLGTMSRDALNVSGQLDINKPQFEFGGLEKGASKLSGVSGAAKGPLTSGAHMSDAPVGNHLGGTQRLFSDQTSLASTGSPLAAGNASSTVALSRSVPLSGTSWPSSMQVGASNFGTDVSVGAHGDAAVQSMQQTSDGVVSGPNLSQNVGHHIGSPGRAALDGGQQLGPSGAVSDQLGGRQLLASDSIPTYRPTFGDSTTGSFTSPSLTPSSTPASSAGTHATGSSTDAGSAIRGLKAKQLSLKTPNSLSKTSVPEHRPVMDHIAHQTKAHGSHAVGKAGDAMDQTAHTAINKVGTHKPHISGDHKISHAADAKHVTPKTHSDVSAAKAQPVEQKLAQADLGQATGTDGIAPATDATGTYTVRAGDNLWNIARDHLGSGQRWTEIYKLNTDVLGSNPSLIHGGTTIRLPGAGTEIATAGAEAGKYVVQPGDNLWDIASEKLGGGQNWGELYKANSNVIGSNPRLILPGQELSLSGQPGMQVASHGPTVQPTIAQQPPMQPMAQAATPAAPPAAEVAQPNAVAETAAPTATYEQVPTPAAHPVMPASHVEQSSLPPAEAAQAPSVHPTPTIKPTGSSIVSSTLRPDLSFLSKKPK